MTQDVASANILTMASPIPITIAACGALTGDKFKTTIKQITPNRSETILENDIPHLSSSATAMADCMSYITRKHVIPRQEAANRKSGIRMSSPIIMGWEHGNTFSDNHAALKKYPPENIPTETQKERDGGAMYSAVDHAYKDSGLDSRSYMAAYRLVAIEPFGPIDKVEPDPILKKFLWKLVQRASLGEKEALAELRQFAFMLGHTVGNKIKSGMRSGYGHSLTRGNRYSQINNDRYGTLGQRFFRLWDLRKCFADGFRNAVNFDPNHVLCIKQTGFDKKDRPLVNIAESIAQEDFINNHYMRMSDLKSPYV